MDITRHPLEALLRISLDDHLPKAMSREKTIKDVQHLLLVQKAPRRIRQHLLQIVPSPLLDTHLGPTKTDIEVALQYTSIQIFQALDSSIVDILPCFSCLQ